MEVRPRFKNTELGLIPEDWEIKAIKQFASVKGGKRLPLGRLVVDKATPHPYLRVTDMRPGGVELRDIKFVPEEAFPQIRNYRIFVDDIFISVAGSLGIVGKIPSEIDGASLTENANRITDIGCNRDFLLYFLLSDRIQGIIESERTGGAQPKLALGRIENFTIPLPPTEAEQHAIAAVLSDVDVLLGALDRLITKKRDLKQAAMQQLLTGQTRLPGFGGKWEVKRLGDVLAICHGKSQRDVEVSDGAYPILATGGQIGTARRPLYDEPSVLIGRKGTINQPQYMDTPFWTVDTLFYSAVKRHNSAKFLYYRFCLIDWMQYNEASGVPSLNARTIEGIEIDCPEPAEQTAIATILSDMDAELSALEARRNKTRALKQAMMQELLTGRIRLISGQLEVESGE